MVHMPTTHAEITAAPDDNSINGYSLYLIAIVLTVITCGLAIVNWGNDLHWQFSSLSTYRLFPLLGLLAFSIMWSQYVMEAVKNASGKAQAIKKYSNRTSLLVLALIVLHPGLLIAQRYKDGYGLPPGSYESYVAPGLGWITLLGTFSFFMFLAFEFRRRFGQKSWWKYVLVLNDIAILAIFYHGLRLGRDLATGNWYHVLWFFYGTILLVVLGYKYYQKFRARQQPLAQ